MLLSVPRSLSKHHHVTDTMDPVNPKFHRKKGKKGVFLVKHSFAALY